MTVSGVRGRLPHIASLMRVTDHVLWAKAGQLFFESLSLFLLPSREDSWPLVMLEAAAAGVPVVCFQRSGGAEEFLAKGGGTAVPYLDVEAMAQAAVRYVSEPHLRERDSCVARQLVRAITREGQINKIASGIAQLVDSRPVSDNRRLGAPRN